MQLELSRQQRKESSWSESDKILSLHTCERICEHILKL